MQVYGCDTVAALVHIQELRLRLRAYFSLKFAPIFMHIGLLGSNQSCVYGTRTTDAAINSSLNHWHRNRGRSVRHSPGIASDNVNREVLVKQVGMSVDKSGYRSLGCEFRYNHTGNADNMPSIQIHRPFRRPRLRRLQDAGERIWLKTSL